jgi:phytoene dehydrogenase-like protein
VNRVAQGADVAAETPVQGLYLVGDAVKPSGYLMVEGVAQSVNTFLDLLDKSGQSNVMKPPSRLNALRWLWEAPGNA